MSSPPPPPPPPPGYGPPGQQPPPAPPPGYPSYGFSPYGGPPALEHPQGTSILVLGILSLVVCGVLGPFAWKMGNTALGEIDSSGQRYSNRGNVTAGRICGIIGTVLLALQVLFFLVVILGMVAATR